MSAVIRCWCGTCCGMVTFTTVEEFLAKHRLHDGTYTMTADSIEVRPPHRDRSSATGSRYFEVAEP